MRHEKLYFRNLLCTIKLLLGTLGYNFIAMTRIYGYNTYVTA